MNNLTEIKDYDVLAGTDIREAVEEAIKLTELNKCVVRFDFNGVEMKVYHFSEVKNLVDYYYRRLKE
jgi:hypothetical protein